MSDQSLQQNISSLTIERDRLMKDLEPLRNEKNVLLKEIAVLAKSKTDIQKESDILRGKVQQMEEYEGDRSVLISQDIATLSNKKVALQVAIVALEKELPDLESRKAELKADINFLLPISEGVMKQVSGFEKFIETVVRINNKNIDDVNILVANLKKLLTNKK